MKCGKINPLYLDFALLFSLVSCQVETPALLRETGEQISISISAHVSETKTTLNDNGSITAFGFEGDDCIGYYAEGRITNCKLQCADVDNGIFSASLDANDIISNEPAPDVRYCVYYPYNSEAGSNPTQLNGFLPPVQNAPFDDAADYLIATPQNDSFDITNLPKLDFSFDTHLFAIVKLSITNTSDELAEERIHEIGLKSSSNILTGKFTFNVTNPEEDVTFSSTPEEVSKRVRVEYPEADLPILGKNITHTVYAVVNASEFEAGTLILRATTSNYSFSLPTKKSTILSGNQLTVFPTVDLADEGVVRNSSSKNITSFTLSDGVKDYGAFEITDDLISVHVPNATNLSNLIASFECEGAAVSVNGIEQVSGVSAQDFSDFLHPVTYVARGIDEDDCKSYSIRIFNLPIVKITTPAPITSRTVWVDNCSIKITDDNGVTTDYGDIIQIRGRGNGSWSGVKKPYTFKLSNKASVLGMPADKRWNLLANFWDKTLIRNDVCLEIGRRAEGLGWTSHGEFVEVIMNGDHLGNFYLCEHNKVAKDRVNITEMKVGDTSEPEITGGYLLEYDTYIEDEPTFITSTCNYRVKIKSPDDDGFDLQWAWIEGYINSVEGILSDPESIATHRYLDYIDIDSFIDWWLVYEISGNGTEPNAPRSCYMNKDRGGKLKAGPVWDFDLFTFLTYFRNGFRLKSVLYYKYLFEDPLFVAAVKDRWALLKTNLIGMPEYIDQLTNKVYNSAVRDKSIYPQPTDDWNFEQSLSVAEAYARLKSTYEARIIELDGLINALTATLVDGTNGTENYGGQTNPDFGFGF